MSQGSRRRPAQWLFDLVVDQRTGSGWRIPALDGLRGIAAMMVLVAHTRHATVGDDDSLWWAPIERGGAGGVVLFFALSGFLLYLPWHRATVEGRPPPSLKSYALRRCLRIMPAFYASVILLAVMRVVIGGRDPLGAPALMLHFLFLPTLINPLQTVYWTLQTEEFFYWLLPVLHRLVNALGTPWVLAGACCMSLVWAAIGFALIEPSQGRLNTWLEQTPFFLPAFALGIYTAVRWCDRKQDPSGRWMVLAGTAMYILYTPLAAYISARTDHVATQVTELMMVPAASAVVLGAARGGAPILEHPFLRFLGGISFSLYLWHFVVIRTVPVPDAIAHSFALRLPYTIAIAIPVAFASYACIERPFLKLRPSTGKVSDDRGGT